MALPQKSYFIKNTDMFVLEYESMGKSLRAFRDTDPNGTIEYEMIS